MKSVQRIRIVLAVLLLLLIVVGTPGQPTLATPDNGPAGAYKAGTVLLGLQPGVRRASLNATLKRLGATAEGAIYGSDVQILRVPKGRELAVSAALAKNPDVRFAEPDYVYQAFVTPDDPYFLSHQWGHLKIRSEAAWDVTTGSSDLVIAILDSGVDETHPELQSKLVPGHSFLDGAEDSTPHDLHGHGTHVAGIAAAITNNGTGIAGMSWGAKIMPVRVLDADGSGFTSDIAAGINWARENGADIINLSLGGDDGSAALQQAIDAAYAEGIFIVAAMGNDGDAGVKYPAASEHVMAVAATTQTDLRASYSNYGPHCDIAAPGGFMEGYHDPRGIYSLMPTYDVTLTTEKSYFKNYDYLYGTSQAAPFVAGLAALIWSTDASLTPDEIQIRIQDAAVDLGTPGWDQYFGHGRIDAEAALDGVLIPAPTLLAIENADNDGDFWVRWTDVSIATGYRLEEDTDPAFGSPTLRYAGPSNQYHVMGQPMGTWYYRVRAVNADGESEWSEVRSVEVKPGAPILNPITNLGQPDAYRLSWEAVQGALGYRLQESDDISFTTPITRYLGTDLSYDVTGQPGGRWYYRVQAYNEISTSPWSTTRYTDVVTSTVPSPVLQPIDNSDGDRNYTITWTAVPTPTGYTLEQSSSVYFSAPTLAYTGTFTQVTALDQAPGQWYYRVRAHTALGSSPWSNIESVVVPYHIHLSLILRDYPPPLPSHIENGDFEAGSQGWTEYSRFGFDLIVDNTALAADNVTAHSGSWATWLGGANNEVSSIEQAVTVGAAETHLAYWRWIHSNETDCLSDGAEILINNVVVDSYALCASNNTAGWTLTSVDLGAYEEMTVTLTFKTTLDGAVNSNLFIDDVSFETSAVSQTVRLDRTPPVDVASPKPER
ncbi:MAG: S8 family serine peptidase [Anaerolineae bacterium]